MFKYPPLPIRFPTPHKRTLYSVFVLLVWHIRHGRQQAKSQPETGRVANAQVQSLDAAADTDVFSERKRHVQS